MSPYELRARIQQEPDSVPAKRRERVPPAVAFLALYELAKAGVFLLIFTHIWIAHLAQSDSGNFAYDPLLTDPRSLLFPFAAVIFLAIGWAIWRLQSWARPVTIAVFLLLAVYCWSPGTQLDVIPGFLRQANAVTAILLIELTSIAALYLLNDVTDAFERAAQARQL